MVNLSTEAQEQATLIAWLEYMNLKFTSIPNSTYTTSWKQKAFNRNQGLRKGFPDLVVLTKSKILFIEMKRLKGSITSPEQREWVCALNNYPSTAAKVCKGSDEAIEFIKANLP